MKMKHDEQSLKEFFGESILRFMEIDDHCWLTDGHILIRMDNTVGWWRANRELKLEYDCPKNCSNHKPCPGCYYSDQKTPEACYDCVNCKVSQMPSNCLSGILKEYWSDLNTTIVPASKKLIGKASEQKPIKRESTSKEVTIFSTGVRVSRRYYDFIRQVYPGRLSFYGLGEEACVYVKQKGDWFV